MVKYVFNEKCPPFYLAIIIVIFSQEKNQKIVGLSKAVSSLSAVEGPTMGRPNVMLSSRREQGGGTLLSCGLLAAGHWLESSH